MSPSRLDVPELLHLYGIHPDKRLGQNFLVDPGALQGIIRAAGITTEDVVLEIGPGLGSLTGYLAEAARSVVAVEIDPDLFPILHDVLQSYRNIRLVQGDILQLDPGELMGNPGYLVVANIPYYITSSLFRHLLEASSRPKRMVLTVQKEVAERITASPGDMSLLSLGVQLYGKPEIVARIESGSFYPVPQVDSAVVRVNLFTRLPLPQASLDRLFFLARAGFSQKRKTLRNSLSAGLGVKSAEAETLLSEAGIDPRRRAETLSVEEWIGMEDVYSKRHAS